MMLWSLLLAALCGIAVALFDPMLEQHWQMWKKTHGKNYQTEVEELGRREVWERNLQLINLHNLEASMDMHTYDLGMNHMGDMTQEEIAQSFASLPLVGCFFFTVVQFIPNHLNWVEVG
uniref:Cathepsin S n=1 Tax=Salmo trutta TaxID=8032 RepID=A0A674EL06_SALTR